MNKQGKELFLDTLKNICIPDDCESNISKCIDVDSFKIMREFEKSLLSFTNTTVSSTSYLYAWFDDNASVIVLQSCINFKSKIDMTLCHMDMLSLPYFFTLMMYLVAHLVDEAKLGGLV